MKLLEHQSKRLLHAYSIPIPDSHLIDSLEDIWGFRGEMVLKAQVHTGRRGRTGGIRFADGRKDAKERTREILKMDIGGFDVKSVLMEERVSALNENYLDMLDGDNDTESIVLVGEIDGTAEERSTKFIRESVSRLVCACIAGLKAPPGRRMGHAEAIISDFMGTARSKIGSLRRAGVRVATTANMIPDSMER